MLRDMGEPHVMNSRTLDFADKSGVTGGRGVDAVLNSLAGDFIPKSFSVLAPFGRFLEIGKIDVYGNTKIGLEQLRENISYFVIDLAQYLENRPQYVASMFVELSSDSRRVITSPSTQGVSDHGSRRCVSLHGPGQARRQERAVV